MHEKNLEELKEEANRLIRLEIDILNDIDKLKPDETKHSLGTEKQILSKDRINTYISSLNNTIKNLETFNLVIAVVGTMKAGKSTLINAIVGNEVLPYHNRPMTTLPTMIVHQNNIFEPKMTFKGNEKLFKYKNEIKEKLAKNPNLKNRAEKGAFSSVLSSISTDIATNFPQNGIKQVYGFLSDINDLVRLGDALGIDNTIFYGNFSDMDDLPKINIDFVHLREMKTSMGQLSLLDTPGPNEAGRQYLKKIMKDQLQKASAVISVMDYTQIGSEADSSVRNSLIEIAKASRDKLFIMVNKFDQKDRRGLTREQVVDHVCNYLTFKDEREDVHSNDKFLYKPEPEYVFPVSAQYAYLANRALNELNTNNKLPEPKEEENEWVNDFLDKTFGMDACEADINDVRTMKTAASKLWEKSLFDVPMEKIIKTAYLNAAIMAMQSTAEKLLYYANEIKNDLNININSLEARITDLEKWIKNLNEDITAIEKLKKETIKKSKDMNSDLCDTLIDISNQKFQETNKILERWRRDGKIDEEQLEKKKAEKSRPENRRGIAGWLFDFILGSKANSDIIVTEFDPNNPIIKFDSRNEASRYAIKIGRDIKIISEATKKAIADEIQKISSQFEKEIKRNTAEGAKEIADRIKKYAKETQNVEINIDYPNIESIVLTDVDLPDLIDRIEDKAKTVHKSRVKDGMFSRFFNWLNDDWGRESYQDTEEWSEINMKSLSDEVAQFFKSYQDTMIKNIEESFSENTSDTIEQLFNSFTCAVEELQGTIMQGMKNNKEKDKAQKNKIIEELKRIEHRVPSSDCEILSQDVQELRKRDEIHA